MPKRFVILLFLAHLSLAQQQSFDTYTYEAPVGYTVQQSSNATIWTKIDQKKRSYCQIGLYRSQASLGSPAQDMDAEWKAVVMHQLKVTGPVVNREIPLPQAPTSLIRGAEAVDPNGNKALPSLFVLRFPGRYVGVLLNASGPEAFQSCQDEVSRVVLSLKLTNSPAPSAPTATSAPSTPMPGSIVGTWQRIIASQPSMRYNPFSKQWEYDAVGAMNQFKQTHRFRFTATGEYTYELDAEDFNRSRRTRIIEQGAYAVSNGTIQFQPKSIQEGIGPRNQDPPLTTKATPAPHSRRFLLGEHPQYKESPGLQLQTQDGNFETYKPIQ